MPLSGFCSDLNAVWNASKLGIIPLPAANAPALTKLRKCVIGLRTVFASCDVAFGYNIKLL